ncbi:hypothetical protein MZ909_06680 [Thermosynechococcus sp. B0]|uniref:hypothetical protein n=1 Tax=unclassified Thermosynechococcus TaxID=2622553 RepID=UPI00257604B9|nr:MULTISPECIES: hypothetical protein [unclassified Thermosynechococcus]WJI22919.1 hypothetical protein MZ909_06680 [Thermosynechococcus sp. B0]WJI25435.1 hypothetical protein M0644_06760 [Thermosynechococcus sp. B1]
MLKQRATIITIAVGLLASGMSGCGFIVTEVEIDPTNQPDQPVAPPAAAAPDLEPEPPSVTASAVAALIPPTNPKTYIEGLANVGRANPFAPLLPPNRNAGPKGETPNGAPVATGNAGNDSPQTPAKGTGTPSAATKPTPLPPPPPVDAQAVKVFGVAAVNGRLQAIIRSPKENVTRTVQVGDTIAGNVLVRAIDAYDTTPAVVLEQFGQTVRLTVGQPATAQGATPPAI